MTCFPTCFLTCVQYTRCTTDTWPADDGGMECAGVWDQYARSGTIDPLPSFKRERLEQGNYCILVRVVWLPFFPVTAKGCWFSVA